MKTIIERLKAEVERRMFEDYNSDDEEQDAIAQGVCASLLSFLDTLKEQPVCEGLEEEIYNYANTIAEGTHLFEIIPQTARHFAKWQKEQMMRSAMEGKVRNIIIHENGDEVHYSITYPKGKSQYSINDKVKIIIL